jgi:cytochrome c5
VINRVAFSFLAVLVAASAFAQDLTDAQLAAIEARIKPAGESCMQGDNSCGAPAVAVAAGPRSGEEVYNAACMACHSTGAAGAPKVGDVAAWAPHIAKGMDVLYVSGVEGLAGTSMIAKGGCMSCSDEEIHASVDYMVNNSQ